MCFRPKLPGFLRWRLLPVLCLALVSQRNASALSTGVPVQFKIDPATVRQREKEETPVAATIVLKVPSPTFFVCQIRSSDPAKASFANIVFQKGQITGTAQGFIHWAHVLKDARVKISAFSVDAPDQKLWSTEILKTKDLNQSESEPNKD